MYLPRFEITSDFDLTTDKTLQAPGIDRALDMHKAEFPGIGPYANWLSIQRFVQKAFVKVNEKGTEAAAVTTAHGRWAEARDIRVGDVLLLRGGANATVTGTILFMGRVMDPSEE